MDWKLIRMIRLLPLKYPFLCIGMAVLIFMAVTVADGNIAVPEKLETLRIIYSGGLMGNIEPCG